MWQANPAHLQQLAALLEQTQQASADQQQLLAQLDAHKGSADFNNSLAYLFARADGASDVARLTAALFLKNNVAAAARAQAQHGDVSAIDVAAVKACTLAMLQCPTRPLRQAAGTLAAAVLALQPLAQWPELVAFMLATLEAGEPGAQEGVLTMLYKITEDTPHQLSATTSGAPTAADALMPAVAAVLGSAAPADVRHAALRAFNMLATLMPQWLRANLAAYVAALLELAGRERDERILKEVCLGANLLAQERPEAIAPHAPRFVAFMLAAMDHPASDVAIEATAFWMQYAEVGLPVEALTPVLPRLVERLLTHMVFEEHDDEVAAAVAAEAGGGVEDARELKPFHHSHGAAAGGGDSAADTDDGEEAPTEYTLRRSCAQALDCLAVELGDALLPHVMPTVEAYIRKEDWRLREAAVLALGAVADGCMAALRPAADEIIAMLLAATRDGQPNVRCNACWAAGRFATFVVQEAAEGDAGGHGAAAATMQSLVAALAERAQEHNECVHYAALSALSCVHEDVRHNGAGWLVEGGAPRLVRALLAWLPRFSRRNVRQALETLIQTVQAVPVCMEDPEEVRAYMEPLLARAEASSHHDVELMPLLDALIHLTMAIGGNVEPYAVRLMATAAAVAATHLSPPPAAGPPTNDAITTFALDAATALVEVLAGSTAALLAAVGPPRVLDAAVAACSHGDATVAQSGFALAGELAACAPRALAGRGLRLLDACNARLARGAAADGDAAAVNALNNAAWAVGLLVAGLPGGEGAPHAVPAAERLAALLKAQGSAADADMRRVRENAAISLGRVAAVAPEALAPAAPHFLGEWCRTLAALREGAEKAAGVRGVIALLTRNPDAAFPAFTSLCTCLASWPAPPAALAAEVAALVRALRGRLEREGHWDAALARVETETFSPRVRTRIQQYAEEGGGV